MKPHPSAALSQRGNVLFLILIAVALFAALAYVMSQSMRAGGSGDQNEAWMVQSSQITQYPVSVANSIQKMIIANTDVQAIEFNPPAAFDDLSNPKLGVFHPDGGAATYASAGIEAMEGGVQGTWYFNADFEIVGVGADAANNFEGNDIIAFLPGITNGVCDQVNKRFGITGDIDAAAGIAAAATAMMDNDYSIPSTEQILGGADTPALKGKAFGCVKSNGQNIYYHTIMAR